MSSSDSEINFKKINFKPWDEDLASTLAIDEHHEISYQNNFINNDNLLSDEFDFLRNDLDLTLSHEFEQSIETTDYLLEKPNYNNQEITKKIKLSDDEINSTQSNTEVKNRLRNAARDKERLSRQLSEETKSEISFGGFVNVQNNTAKNRGVDNGGKIRGIRTELVQKEHEIYKLSSDLKISQALERAENAESAKMYEMENRKKAEQRMAQAIEQANIAVKKLHESMEKIDIAEAAQYEEEILHKETQAKLDEAKSRAATAEMSLQAEQKERLAAENKAENAIKQAVQAELNKQELHEQLVRMQKDFNEVNAKYKATTDSKYVLEKEKKKLEDEYQEIKKLYNDITKELNSAQTKRLDLESTLKHLTLQYQQLEVKYLETNDKAEKFKKIIESEREIRKVADKKMREAVDKAMAAEKERDHEIKQRQLTDERAKKAVAHATRTVMQFLNNQEQEFDDVASIERSDATQIITKKRIKVSSSTQENEIIE